jgi:hypothetical protein
MARKAMSPELRREWRSFRITRSHHERLRLVAARMAVELQDVLELSLVIVQGHLGNGAPIESLPLSEDAFAGWKACRVPVELHEWLWGMQQKMVELPKPIRSLQDVGELLIEYGLLVMERKKGDLAQFVNSWLCTQENQERVDKFALAMQALGEELGDGTANT